MDKTLNTPSCLYRHLKKIYYLNLFRKHPFECPHPLYNKIFIHISHFQLHAMQIYKIKYTKKKRPSDAEGMNKTGNVF